MWDFTFFLTSPTVLKAGSGERRERGNSQGSGATADQRKQFHVCTRGLEGQRCGEDAGGAACQGEGQKPTLGKQEMPGAATLSGAGGPLLLCSGSLIRFFFSYSFNFFFFFFLLSWLVGGAEVIRVRSPHSCQESHQRTGATTERVRQSKRVLYLYSLYSFNHSLTMWTKHLKSEIVFTHLAHPLFVCLQQGDARFRSHQLSS